ncbi:MAG: putative metallopeptidase [archaeon]|nr:putative metallopeptidase [archaeon]
MKYEFDEAWTASAKEIARTLNYSHVIPERLSVVKSQGSKTKRTIARIHCIGKVIMLGMGHKKSFYVIELISEKFDRQSRSDQIETIIHELMHIPKTYGGGFRHHNHVCSQNVKAELARYMNLCERPQQARLY